MRSCKLMFVQLPHSLFKEHLAPPTLPTALVTISGGSLCAAEVEVKVAKIASLQSSWKWEAVPHGDNAFLVCFPSIEILKRVAAFEYNVKSYNVKVAFSEWIAEEVTSVLPLQPVWVHVTGVPPPLRHFLGLWAVGSVIGATQDVDLVSLRRHGIVRIHMAVHSLNIFSKKDGSVDASVSSDVYVKLNGYSLRFVLEDYVPDVDFMPRIWENHDDGHEDGANRDEDMPDRDASKRSKNVQAVGENTTLDAQTSSAVPMKSMQRSVQAAEPGFSAGQPDVYMAATGLPVAAAAHANEVDQAQSPAECAIQAVAVEVRSMALGYMPHAAVTENGPDTHMNLALKQPNAAAPTLLAAAAHMLLPLLRCGYRRPWVLSRHQLRTRFILLRFASRIPVGE